MNKEVQNKIFNNKKSLFLLLLLLTFFGTSKNANAFLTPERVNVSQVIVQDKITINIQNRSAKQILTEIEKKSKIGFAIKEDGDKSDLNNLSLNVKDVTVKEALDFLFAETNHTYQIVDNIITIVRKPQTAMLSQKTVVVSGKVISAETKTPIIGATILVKGTNKGAITDDKGRFSFTAAVGQEIEVSFIGMKTLLKKITSEAEMVLTMERDAMAVDDVVVTGIFKRSKETSTGSSITVSGEELRRVGNQNILQSLKTLDPSFKMIENNASGSNPNVLPDIELRGANGIAGLDADYKGKSNQPLFILDGFETSLQRVVDLDPNRVQTISILKDASAAALYGSRSANGVIVIETKAPEIGDLKLSYTGDFAVVAPDLTDYDLLNAREKLDLEYRTGHFNSDRLSDQVTRMEYYNRLLTNVTSGVDTYWLSKPLRTPFEHRHNVDVSGGDEVIRYGVNFSAKLAPGVMKGSNRNTYQGGVFLSYRKGNLMFKNDLQIVYNVGNDSPYGTFSQYTKLNQYHKVDNDGTLSPLFDEKLPSGFQADLNRNPLYDATLKTINKNDYMEYINNFSAEWKISPSLTVMGRLSIGQKSEHGENFLSAKHSSFATLGSADGEPEEFLRRGSFKQSDGREFNISGDVNIRYGASFGKHILYAVGGLNIMNRENKGTMVQAEGFPNDNMSDISFAKQYYKDTRPTTNYDITRLVGVLATFNYTYDYRYLLDLSLKVDGSSKFGANNRYAPVWSVGAGWNLHREEWIKKIGWISFFKLRASYGVTGSQEFSPFQAIQMYNYNTNKQYAGIVSPTLQGLGNPDLKWQRSNKLNAGVELGLVDDRLTIIFDWYDTQTKDLLGDMTIAPSNGFTKYKSNIGETNNRGMDLSLRYMAIRDTQKGIYWSINASASHNKNKIMKISNAMKARNDAQMASASNATRPVTLYVENNSLSTIYAVPSLGIDPATGQEMFLTRYGKKSYVWDYRDQVAVGETRPNIEGIIGTSFSYKDLSFSVNFRYTQGGQIYNQTLVERVECADLYGNVDRRVLEQRWSEPGQVSFLKSIYDKEKTRPTGRFVQDENVFSCESVNLSYDVRNKRVLNAIAAERLRFSFYMNDLFRISSVKRERGLDYPFANRFAFSINVTF